MQYLTPPTTQFQQNHDSTRDQTIQNQIMGHNSLQPKHHINVLQLQKNSQYPTPKTNNDINIKQSTSYLGSNGTSDNNDNMATTERNVKEITSVELLLQKMVDGPAGGKSM